MTTGSWFPGRRALVAVTGGAVVAGGLLAAGSFAQGSEDDGSVSKAGPVLRAKSGEAIGADVVVFSFYDGIHSYGSADGYVGYSIGTRSCNRGDAHLNWCSDVNAGHCAAGATVLDHPVIAQNLYRLKDGRFEQIGMSWLKHGFQSTNSATAGCNGASGTGGCSPSTPEGSAVLRIGCSDPYSWYLNGGQPLGRRSEVDGTTVVFPSPSSPSGPYTVYDERIKVPAADVDPTLNPGAMYWGEAQYFAKDDAASGNALNNASYQRAAVASGSPDYTLSATGTFFEQQPAINAWRAQDPSVFLANADVPGNPIQRFQVARKVTELGGGQWHYEYAVRNHNSDRSARAFAVKFPQATTFTNIGFSDVDSHSGEPYATTDWSAATMSDSVAWSTLDFATDENANALRFATMYNFWFDADHPPSNGESGVLHDIVLFKPGSPMELTFDGFRDLFINGFEGGDTTAWSGAS